MNDQATHSCPLHGIESNNPLGFLAAIGTLRTLQLGRPDWTPKMSWSATDNWHPCLHTETPVSREDLITALHDTLRTAQGHSALDVGDDIKLTPNQFRDHYHQMSLQEPHRDPQSLRFLAALGSDALVDDQGQIQDTALRTMSGAGHQHFLRYMRTLTAETNHTHLEKALFERWRRDDPSPSMRWDPSDDRRYALRWKNPSDQSRGYAIKTVRGANRLAIEALPLLPTAVEGARLRTTGFSGTNSTNTFLTWPIWNAPLGCDSVASLIALRELQRPAPNRNKLAAMGVVEVYRSQRIRVNKNRSFTVATPA